MRLPVPLPGLVIRYGYLWADDAAKGREEGGKERPAVVVLVVEGVTAAAPRVIVLPITHSPPTRPTEAIEIPSTVCRAAGLDAARSWVVISEFNEFTWPGFDLALVPGRHPSTVAYGYFTSGFFAKVRDRWLALDEARKSTSIPRDE